MKTSNHIFGISAVLAILLGAGSSGLGAAATNAGMLQFSAAQYRVGEASRVARITIVRRGGSAGEIAATVSTTEGSAQAGVDYTEVVANLVFGPGIKSRVVDIPLLDDFLNDPNETVNLRLSTTDASWLGPTNSAVLTIVDNDPAGVVQFSAASYSVSETATVARIVVQRLSGTASNVAVTLATREVSATAWQDYSEVITHLLFGRNQTTRVVEIPLHDDSATEGGESFQVELSSPLGGVRLGKTSTAMVNLTDNEPAFYFSRTAYSVSEAGKRAIVTVLRSGPLTNIASVECVIGGDAAALRSAGVTPRTNLLTFGRRVAAQTVSVPVINNTLDDGDRTVTVTLQNPTNAELGTVREAFVTIVDNDAGGLVSLGATNYNATSISGKVTVYVRRTGGSASEAGFTLSTSDDTAVAGVDYLAVSTNIAFRAGELARAVSIPLTWDYARDVRKQFRVNLTAFSGGTQPGLRTNATVTIGLPMFVDATGGSEIMVIAFGTGFLRQFYIPRQGEWNERSGRTATDFRHVVQLGGGGGAGFPTYLSIQAMKTAAEVKILHGSVDAQTDALVLSFPVVGPGLVSFGDAGGFTQYSAISQEQSLISGGDTRQITAAWQNDLAGRVVVDSYQTNSVGLPKLVGGRFDIFSWSPELNRRLRLYGYFRVRP